MVLQNLRRLCLLQKPTWNLRIVLSWRNATVTPPLLEIRSDRRKAALHCPPRPAATPATTTVTWNPMRAPADVLWGVAGGLRNFLRRYAALAITAFMHERAGSPSPSNCVLGVHATADPVGLPLRAWTSRAYLSVPSSKRVAGVIGRAQSLMAARTGSGAAATTPSPLPLPPPTSIGNQHDSTPHAKSDVGPIAKKRIITHRSDKEPSTPSVEPLLLYMLKTPSAESVYRLEGNTSMAGRASVRA